MANLHKKEYYGDNVAEVTTVIGKRAAMDDKFGSILVSTAIKFESSIKCMANGKTCDAKNLLLFMAMIGMNLTAGTEITISASGSDASEAVKALIERIDLMGEQ